MDAAAVRAVEFRPVQHINRIDCARMGAHRMVAAVDQDQQAGMLGFPLVLQQRALAAKEAQPAARERVAVRTQRAQLAVKAQQRAVLRAPWP